MARKQDKQQPQKQETAKEQQPTEKPADQPTCNKHRSRTDYTARPGATATPSDYAPSLQTANNYETVAAKEDAGVPIRQTWLEDPPSSPESREAEQRASNRKSSAQKSRSTRRRVKFVLIHQAREAYVPKYRLTLSSVKEENPFDISEENSDVEEDKKALPQPGVEKALPQPGAEKAPPQPGAA